MSSPGVPRQRLLPQLRQVTLCCGAAAATAAESVGPAVAAEHAQAAAIRVDVASAALCHRRRRPAAAAPVAPLPSWRWRCLPSGAALVPTAQLIATGGAATRALPCARLHNLRDASGGRLDSRRFRCTGGSNPLPLRAAAARAAAVGSIAI